MAASQGRDTVPQRVAQLRRPPSPTYGLVVSHKPKKPGLRRRSSLSADLEGQGARAVDRDDQLVTPWKSHGGTLKEARRKKNKEYGSSDDEDYNNIVNSPHHYAHSSLSVVTVHTNNAITIAPSRLSTNDPNVFQTSLSKQHQIGRRPRPRTPDVPSGSRATKNDLEQMLSRLDNRIRNNFGDWSNMDDDKNFEFKSFPSRNRDEVNGPTNSTSSVALPALYKNYQTVIKSSKGKLLDRSKMIALSKDNNDPESILSQAKRTLTQIGTK